MTDNSIDNDNDDDDDDDDSMDNSADETSKTAEYMERRNEYLRFWPGHLAALALRHANDEQDYEEDDIKVVEWKELIDAWQG
eukprot:scaffold238020_cov35-Attheya_sp.AAC.1